MKFVTMRVIWSPVDFSAEIDRLSCGGADLVRTGLSPSIYSMNFDACIAAAGGALFRKWVRTFAVSLSPSRIRCACVDLPKCRLLFGCIERACYVVSFWVTSDLNAGNGVEGRDVNVSKVRMSGRARWGLGMPPGRVIQIASFQR